MANILKEILKKLPADEISESGFEGANIVLYTKSREFFFEGQSQIKELVNEFKKRIELRPDPSITMNQNEAEEMIRKLIPEEVAIDTVVFDPPRSSVILHVDKPGMAIGKDGSLLREIKEKTFWIPTIKRTPPIKSRIIEEIRSVLYEHADERKKFLNKVGHRVYDGWLRGKKEEWIRVTFLGGAKEVGRSALLLQTPESRVLLDFGYNVASEEHALPYMDAPEFHPKDIDAVIVTHSHLDHSGMIPFLFKLGYDGPVYCTAPTRDVMSLLQLDMIKIAMNSGKDPLYTSEHIRKMVLNTITLNFDEVTDITPDVRLTLYNSGHILGSSIVHLHIGNGLHNLVYTGDLKYGKSVLLPRAHKQFNRVETLIIESTYGGKDDYRPIEENPDEQLKDMIVNTTKAGGKVLMPVLGSGRAQDIMVMIAKMVQERKLEPVNVYVDGMVWDITAIHTAYPEYLNRDVREMIFQNDNNPFLMPIFKRVGSVKEREQVINEEGACVILATSGMLTGGPSVQYLKELASDSKNVLLFTCYQGEGSLGRRISHGEREFSFQSNGSREIVKLNLDVSKISVSDHSDRRELMNYVRDITPQPRKVIVQHGEKSKSLDFAMSISKKFDIEADVPMDLEAIRLR